MVAMSAFTAFVGEASVQFNARLDRPTFPATLSLISSTVALAMGSVWTGRASFALLARRAFAP